MTISRRTFFLGKRGLAESTSSRSESATPVDPILHLLNRISYGPRPIDLAHAHAVGYAATLEEQLSPESIDDSALDEKLQMLPILAMSRWEAHSLEGREGRCQKALIQGMILRGVSSNRQLLERMAEFWSDHFNIPASELGPDLIEFQRDVIHKLALGNFEELLIATAKSPAMLIYLDNYANVVGAPNENYARELLELHTLGVDGGYTEADVKEVARAFTGWTTHARSRGGFYFSPDEHDSEEKSVLGHSLPAGRGIEDGLAVLRLVARHPATARFISFKLCRRFVSDTPPESLVASLAAEWQATNGNMKAVLRQLFQSEEFLAATGQKLRRPLEFLIGVLRTTGTTINRYYLLEEILLELGQPPYGWEPPNGYPDVAAAWSSTNGLLARWNVAMRLTSSAYSDGNDSGWGFTSRLNERIGEQQTVGGLVDQVAIQIFGRPLQDAERAFYIDFVTDGSDTAPHVDSRLTPRLQGRKLGSLFGLMLASPAYQWR